MCDPVSITLGVISVATAAYGAYSQQKAASDQAKYAKAEAERNASIARQKASILETAAQREEQYAKEQAKQIRDRGRRLLSTNRAQLANSGIEFSGSALDINEQNINATELDAQKAIDYGAVAAHNKRIQGTSAQNEAIGFDSRASYYGSKTGIDYLSIGVAGVSAAASAYGSSGGFKTGGATTGSGYGVANANTSVASRGQFNSIRNTYSY